MIVDVADLDRYRDAVTLVDGVFDPLHEGHVAYFAAAAALGLPVMCNVTHDAHAATKHPALLNQRQRATIIDAFAAVDFTLATSRGTAWALEAVRPRYYAKGNDWRGRLPARETDLCRRLGIEIVYLDTLRDSSTDILRRFASPMQDDSAVDRFEATINAQAPVSAGIYDAPYFLDNWRQDGADYGVEARRRVEGRHPALVAEVFGPERVLDMGCGPGAFLALLEEAGIVADGIDISPVCRQRAPASVRERIRTASITDPVVPDGGYDLVICREVLEHMTVLEVCQAVRRMCRATSRYVYVTTRFHPAPWTLFDLTDELDVDPTHITLMNRAMLRLLFVLEGLRRRPDLERRMDWLDKGRVLVYEKRHA